MTAPPTPGLYPALLAAQAEFNPVVKNKQNPHLKNFYADLSAVLEAVTEPLANHGLLIVQRFGHDQGGPILITEIVHAESGQSICSALPIVSKDPTDPQKLGGAITYARRYSLLAILSLTAEDDDGNSASQPSRKQEERPRPQPAPSTAKPAPQQAKPQEEHPLLATIRDDTLDPKKRETALHNYMMTATNLAELGAACILAERAGIPDATLARAKAWHKERIATGKPPAPKAHAPEPQHDGDAGKERATERQIKFIFAVAREAGLDEQEVTTWSHELYGSDVAQLNRRDASTFLEALQRRRNEVA